MRQTSRAVALLLALDSAQAGATDFPYNTVNLINNALYPNLLVPLGGVGFSAAGARQSRTAPYNNCPGWAFSTTNTTPSCPTANYSKTGVTGAWKAFAAQAVTAAGVAAFNSTTENNTVITVGSYCVPCIQQTGVWCSRTYSYGIVSGTTVFQFESTENTNKDRRMNNIWTGAGAKLDNGSCCGPRGIITSLNLYDITGAIKSVITTSGGAVPSSGNNLLAMNKYACVAFSNGQEMTSTNYNTKIAP